MCLFSVIINLISHNTYIFTILSGPFTVWIKQHPLNYFTLRGEPLPVVEEDISIDDVSKIKVPFFSSKPPVGQMLKAIPSVHEQEDGVIFSVCATGTSSKDSLLSWIRHLEKDGNSSLGTIPVVFTLRTGSKEVTNVEENNTSTNIEESKTSETSEEK